MHRYGRSYLHECRLSEDRRRRRVEAGHANRRRRDQRLLGASSAATLAACRQRQVAVLIELRRVQAANHEQIHQQPCSQNHRHDAAMPQSQPSNALYHTSLSFRTPTPHNGRSARSC